MNILDLMQFNPALLTNVEEGILDILKTSCGISASIHDVQTLDKGNSLPLDILGTCAINEDGFFSIGMKKEDYFLLYSWMTKDQIKKISTETKDLMGEFTNIVFQPFYNLVVRMNLSVNPGLPCVFTGAELAGIFKKNIQKRLVISISTPHGLISFQICELYSLKI